MVIKEGSIVGPLGRTDEDTTEPVPEDAELPDEVDEANSPGQEIEDIKGRSSEQIVSRVRKRRERSVELLVSKSCVGLLLIVNLY